MINDGLIGYLVHVLFNARAIEMIFWLYILAACTPETKWMGFEDGTWKFVGSEFYKCNQTNRSTWWRSQLSTLDKWFFFRGLLICEERMKYMYRLWCISFKVYCSFIGLVCPWSFSLWPFLVVSGMEISSKGWLLFGEFNRKWVEVVGFLY